jgi:hypothetical protein
MITAKRALIATLGVTILATAGATQVLGASGTSNTPTESRDPFESVTVPTGPELPLEKIAAIADEEALRAGEPNPTMSVGTGTLEQAMRTLNSSFSLPEPVTSPGYRALLATPVDLVIMRGIHFTLADAHVRPGSPTPSGPALELVIDSHRGGVYGRGLPTTEQLEHAESVSSALAASRGVIALHRVTSRITGVLDASGGPAHRRGSLGASHATVLVKSGKRLVARTVTNDKGDFVVHIQPGTFTVVGALGGACIPTTVVAKPNETSRTKLTCSIR